MKTNYVVSFDYFRVFSILVIVLGHTLTKSFQSDYPFLSNVIKGGGSLFFVFISGYLFCFLLPKIKGYLPFIASKFKRLVVPYIIFSIPIILYRYIESDSYLYNIDFDVSSIYYPILSVLTGIHMTGYWYIPAIFLFYIFSFDFLIYFSKLSIILRYILVFLFCLLSLYIHRPIENFNVFHSILYFTSFFILGMSFYLDRVRIIVIYNNWIGFFLFLLFLIINYYQVYYLAHSGNYHKDFFINAGFDFTFFKFLIITPFFYCIFEKFFIVNYSAVKKIANMSFVIYLIHPILLSMLNVTGLMLLSESYFGVLINTIIVFSFVVFICLIIHKIIFVLLGYKRSWILGG